MAESGDIALRNIYRNSKLGEALVAAMQPLVMQGRMTPQLALRILDQYDMSMCDALETQTDAKVTLSGEIKKYNNVQNVWLYHIKDVDVQVEAKDRTERYSLRIPRMKITCIDQKLMKSAME